MSGRPATERASAPALLAAALLGWAAGAQAAEDARAPAPPHMQFAPDAAGTYVLQRIQPCPGGTLLDSDGHLRRLSSLTRGKVTLLTFFYTYCGDALGCPFAAGVMAGLRERILAEPALRDRVRFVSISFDPEHDSPPHLQAYARSLARDGRFEWDFLTARSMRQLQPMLEDFGQDVRVEVDAAGRPVRTMDHMLKLFLIDSGGTVREIYALDYLQPDVMLNDIRTLWMEAQGSRAPLVRLQPGGPG